MRTKQTAWHSDSAGFWISFLAEKPKEAEKIIDDFKPGKDYILSVKAENKNRSLNANAYFHSLAAQIAEKVNIGNDEEKIRLVLEYGAPALDAEGNFIVISLPATVNIKQFYDYAKWIGTEFKDGIETDNYLFYKQTHTLSSTEFARLIDGAQEEAKKLGIDTLDEIQLKGLIEEYEKHNAS